MRPVLLAGGLVLVVAAMGQVLLGTTQDCRQVYAWVLCEPRTGWVDLLGIVLAAWAAAAIVAFVWVTRPTLR